MTQEPVSEGRPGATLLVWTLAVLLLNAGAWLSGLRPTQLVAAIERGAARIEIRTRGELSDDTIRKAIRTQRDALPFWRTLALLGDFGVAPFLPALRALTISVVFAALAALTGRPPEFARAFHENARIQGFWVASTALPLLLMLLLGRPDVETSATLFLPSGPHPAALWVALEELAPLTLLGWLAAVRGAWRRRQANLIVAGLACLGLALMEAGARVAWTLVVGAGMRLTILPE